MTELTPKQSRFVEEYLLDLNATQAAMRAGYSAKSANELGAQLLRKPHVKAAIEAGKGERSEETKIDAAWVLKRLALEAEADVADLYHEDGRLKPIHQWPKIWRQGLVAGIEVETLRPKGLNGTGQWRGKTQDVIDDEDDDGDPVEETVVTKIKLSERVRRLELIGKHVGVQAFQENITVSGVEQLADRIARAKAKLGRDG